jgi:hypothetical protein
MCPLHREADQKVTMDGLRISKSGGLPPAAKLIKQFAFGTAVGLTKTAGEAQDAVKGAIRGKFTIRNKWMDSPIGIKRKAANKNDVPIAAEVSTKAKFMKLQDEGGPKLAYKNYLAIPIIPNARASKTALIPKRNLPGKPQERLRALQLKAARSSCAFGMLRTVAASSKRVHSVACRSRAGVRRQALCRCTGLSRKSRLRPSTSSTTRSKRSSIAACSPTSTTPSTKP